MTSEQTNEPDSAYLPRRSRTKTWVGIGTLVGLMAVALFVLHILSSPAQGVITPRLQATNTDSQQPVIIKTKTVAFKYPSQLQKIKADNLAAGDIEKFLFSYPQHGSWSLAILVKKLPGGALAADGNYNLRKQNPEQYTEQTRTINGATVSVMTDHVGSSGQVAFMPHANMVAELALSGSESGSDESQAIFNTVLNSWQWL